MTTLYLIRHAEADASVHDDATRPLTEQGSRDAERLAEALGGIRFDSLYSSPYKRTMDTITPLATRLGLAVETVYDLRERRPADVWVEDFWEFMARQWADFSYKLPGGESLDEVQRRFAAAIEVICRKNAGETIAISSHGTALCAALNYYDKSFGYAEFLKLLYITPFVVRFEFEGDNFLSWEVVEEINDNSRN